MSLGPQGISSLEKQLGVQEPKFLDTQVQQNNYSQPQQTTNNMYQPTQNLISPTTTSVVINQNSSLLPPPKLDVLLNNANKADFEPIRNEPSRIEPPRMDLLNPPIQKLPSVETKPIQQLQPPIQAPNNLLAQISAQRVDNIKNDPMYQQQQQQKKSIFEPDDVEVGNEDLFKTTNKNVMIYHSL